MNDNDMANMIKKAQEMINNNQIPDDLKRIVANMQSTNQSNANNIHSQNTFNNTFANYSQSNSTNNMRENYNKYASTYSQKNNYNNMNQNSNNNVNKYSKSVNSNSNEKKENNDNFNFSNIDMDTMIKIQKIMSKMNSANNDDDMSKLLLSLKPYLRNEKKEKVDEYIKLIKMGKLSQALDLFGGDKH